VLQIQSIVCTFEHTKTLNAKHMETIKIEGREIKGNFEEFPNKAGFYFRLESGELLTAKYKQGYQGKTVHELPVRFNSMKKLAAYFPNSSRQVKDPNAYFLGL
jgi:hypothetical protein